MPIDAVSSEQVRQSCGQAGCRDHSPKRHTTKHFTRLAIWVIEGCPAGRLGLVRRAQSIRPRHTGTLSDPALHRGLRRAAPKPFAHWQLCHGMTSKIHAVVDTRWPADPSRAGARRGARQSASFSSPQRVASQNDVARGSRLRRGLDQGACLPARSMGEHPSETKSQRPDLLQPISVSRTEPDRTVLQQDQAMSACRDPIRQARSQLSRVCQTRINPDLATC
jgi:hypothetical protein